MTALSGRSAAPTEGVRRAVVRTRTRRPTPKLVEALVGVSVAAAVLMAPLVGWIHVNRTVTSLKLSSTAAATLGAKEAGLDATVFDRLTRIIPPDATYWVGTSRLIRSSDARQAFPAWASGALLPRIAVSRPQAADWVVIWGYSPERLRVDYVGLRVLRARSSPRLPVYVARVDR
jgi:hypothetical protein